MESLSSRLIKRIDDKTTEALFDKNDIIDRFSEYFSVYKSQRAVFEKCLDSRLFFYVMYLTNIDEVFFLRYKTISDFIASGASPDDAKTVVDSIIQLAEHVKETEILSKTDDSRRMSYESLSQAVRSYDRGQHKQALPAFSNLAASGVNEAHYYLGKCYLEGKALKKDAERAAKCFTKGASAGFSDPAYYLSLCYLKGDGIEKNAEKGLELLKQAADMGQKDAVYAVGNMYKDGKGGFAADIKKAIEFLQKASDYGNWSASIAICELYYEDAKTTGNFHKTSVARKRLQDVSDPDVCFKIAQIYERGIGVPQNIEKALNFSAKAAAKNYPGATEMMTRLGNLKLGR